MSARPGGADNTPGADNTAGAGGTRLGLAPDTRLTKLPFGGAVLVNVTTLAVTDCGEHEAELVDLLLAHGRPGPAAPPAVREFADQLIAAGWLTTTEPPAEGN